MSKKTKDMALEMKSQPCADCGLRFDPCCMDFDHRPNETKLGHVSQFHGNESLFVAEVAKCDVVCACCHRLRTKRRGTAAKTRQNIRNAWTPELRLKQSEKQREVHNRPDVLERQRIAQQKVQNDPAVAFKKSEAMKKMWAEKKARGDTAR